MFTFVSAAKTKGLATLYSEMKLYAFLIVILHNY